MKSSRDERGRAIVRSKRGQVVFCGIVTLVVMLINGASRDPLWQIAIYAIVCFTTCWVTLRLMQR